MILSPYRKNLATPEEVVKAIESLSDGQLLKLQRSAKWRIRGLGRMALGRDHKDLLNEAITRTLEGKRTWAKDKVDFPGHLIGAMQSISSGWADSCAPKEAAFESELIMNRDGEFIRPINKATAPGIRQEDNIIAKQKIERVEGLFEKDETVLLILLTSFSDWPPAGRTCHQTIATYGPERDFPWRRTSPASSPLSAWP